MMTCIVTSQIDRHLHECDEHEKEWEAKKSKCAELLNDRFEEIDERDSKKRIFCFLDSGTLTYWTMNEYEKLDQDEKGEIMDSYDDMEDCNFAFLTEAEITNAVLEDDFYFESIDVDGVEL